MDIDRAQAQSDMDLKKMSLRPSPASCLLCCKLLMLQTKDSSKYQGADIPCLTDTLTDIAHTRQTDFPGQ